MKLVRLAIGGFPSMMLVAVLAACSGEKVDGVWDTSYGGDTALTLKSADGNVTGTYSGNTGHSGTVTGKLKGKVLAGRFDEGTVKGTVNFTFANDGTSFTGIYTSDDGKIAGSWDGHKRGTPAKPNVVVEGGTRLDSGGKPDTRAIENLGK